MGVLRNSVFVNLLWVFMAFYLLNISVDSADLHPDYIPEDLSINDQESLVEIIVEQVLGYENAIKEYDDHDTNDYNKKKTSTIDFVLQCSKKFDELSDKYHNKKKLKFIHNFFPFKLFLEIDSPPPKF